MEADLNKRDLRAEDPAAILIHLLARSTCGSRAHSQEYGLSILARLLVHPALQHEALSFLSRAVPIEVYREKPKASGSVQAEP